MGVKHILALSCATTGQAYLLQGLVSTRPSALVSVQPVRTAVCEMNMAERFTRLVKSNVNQALNQMEDPEKVLTQAVEDMQKDLIKVRQAYAEVSASTKRMGEQCRVAEAESQKWFSRAQLALERGEDDLAREALTRRQQQTELAEHMGLPLEKLRAIDLTSNVNTISMETSISRKKKADGSSRIIGRGSLTKTASASHAHTLKPNESNSW